MHVEREYSTRHCEQHGKPEDPPLCPSIHPPKGSRPRLPRCFQARELYLSAQHQRGEAPKPAAGIQYSALIQATTSDGDQQQQWTMSFKKAECHFAHEREHVSAHCQPSESRNNVFYAPELSTKRPNDTTMQWPTFAVLTKGCVDGFDREDCHQPAVSSELLGALMPKGRHWLPYTVADVQSTPVAKRLLYSIHCVRAAQVKNGYALPLVVLLDHTLRQIGEYLSLVVDHRLLNQQWIQSGLYQLRATSIRGLRKVLDALQDVPELVVRSFEFSSNGTLGCVRLEQMAQYSVLTVALQHLDDLDNNSIDIAPFAAAAIAFLQDDVEAAQVKNEAAEAAPMVVLL